MDNRLAKPARWWPGFNSQHPIARDCVAYWSFLERAGIKAYDVANPFAPGYHGTLMDGVAWVGAAIDFPTTYPYVAASVPNLADPNVMSIAMRIKTGSSLAGRETVVGRNNAAGATQIEIGTAAGDYTSTVESVIDGVFISRATNSALAVNTWYSIVHTRNGAGDTFDWWIDGVNADGATQNTNAYVNSANLDIGRRAHQVQHFQGQMDYFAIFSRALSALEVAELHDNPYLLIESPTKTYHYYIAPSGGHPAMRRWGGIPHMTPGPVLAGRSW